jgi:hypothetical protein
MTRSSVATWSIAGFFWGTNGYRYSGTIAPKAAIFEFSSSALITIQVLRRMLKIPLLQDLVLMELGLLPHQEPTLH